MDPPLPYHQFEYTSAAFNFPPFASPTSTFHADFGDPAFPQPPPMTDFLSSNDTNNALFSPTEQTNLLGFLDSFEWDFDPQLPPGLPTFSPLSNTVPSLHPANLQQSPMQPLQSPVTPSTTSSLYHAIPVVPGSSSSTNSYASSNASTSSAPESVTSLDTMAVIENAQQPPSPTKSSKSSSNPSGGGVNRPHPAPLPSHVPPHARQPKPLLSTPQKRLNHIMSEQKRRNTIREGYATLTTMLTPEDGTVPRNVRPARGRGGRGRGRGKGKSGVLFRAAEYCRWLEEGVDALIEEVERVESIAVQMRAMKPA